MKIERLYLGVDRQDYVVNWTRHEDRRNVMLHAVGSADNNTGYVFGMHLNYDAMLDSELIEADAFSVDDYQAKIPFRRYARCWLKKDYMASVLRGISRSKKKSAANLQDNIETAYEETILREDVEVSETQDSGKKLALRILVWRELESSVEN